MDGFVAETFHCWGKSVPRLPGPVSKARPPTFCSTDFMCRKTGASDDYSALRKFRGYNDGPEQASASPPNLCRCESIKQASVGSVTWKDEFAVSISRSCACYTWSLGEFMRL